MSLAGAQGKFTLARVGDRWFWPTYEVPSTHILKPPPARKFRGLDALAHAGLELARRVGVPATRSSVDDFLGQSVFIAERWDRSGGTRLHAEDMNQALGRPTADKYTVPAGDIARLLDRHGQAYSFIDQLAFNTALGNCDAHAKNYSVLLAGDRVAVAPIYDTVTTFLWPHLGTRFAMSVGRASHTAELTEKNWRRLAVSAALDADAVCDHAFTAMAAVHAAYGDLVSPLLDGDPARTQLLDDQLSALARALPPHCNSAPTPPGPSDGLPP
ncbi:HipA domain-containing protein [Tsukamurella sp. PLM1]|uniref:HipA domain-containing protein n=1 Tax=Tsukamurella sp. PLM1 TaxID=2929795 RepID=UPI00205064ED|nr:HipA domain-containing protein [Tsukamurella sp. PLM1]BDH57362.1 hypothetical protein MTP03_23010 [Tsukamurella sp. PLM1]